MKRQRHPFNNPFSKLIKLGAYAQSKSLRLKGAALSIPTDYNVNLGPCRVCSRLTEGAANLGTCGRCYDRMGFKESDFE